MMAVVLSKYFCHACTSEINHSLPVSVALTLFSYRQHLDVGSDGENFTVPVGWELYGAPLVQLQKIFLSGGHQIPIWCPPDSMWWPPDNYLVGTR